MLTFNRAAQNDSIGGALFGEIIEAVEAADADPKIRSIITTGTGKPTRVVDAKASPTLARRIDVGHMVRRRDRPERHSQPRRTRRLRVDHIGIGRWVNRIHQSAHQRFAATTVHPRVADSVWR